MVVILQRSEKVIELEFWLAETDGEDRERKRKRKRTWERRQKNLVHQPREREEKRNLVLVRHFFFARDDNWDNSSSLDDYDHLSYLVGVMSSWKTVLDRSPPSKLSMTSIVSNTLDVSCSHSEEDIDEHTLFNEIFGEKGAVHLLSSYERKLVSKNNCWFSTLLNS